MKRVGLDPTALQAALSHKVIGEANINLKLAGFPTGTKADVKPSGMFREVRIDPRRAAPMADTG